MSFVELSIPDPGLSGRPAFDSTIDLWEFTVRHANEACLLLDASLTVVAASPGCGALLSIATTQARGRRLVDVLRLLDFSAVAGKLSESEVAKIPPLLAISTAGLARGLLRVPGPDDAPTTFDAISVPLHDTARQARADDMGARPARAGDMGARHARAGDMGDSRVVGSLTFFLPVRR